MLGAVGVAIGAIGAHAFRPHLSDISFNSFETGVRYHFFHTLLLAAIALADRKQVLRWSFNLVAIGIVCFSFSIYLLSTKALHGIAGVSVLGPVTPIGGLILIAGWLALAFESKKYFND